MVFRRFLARISGAVQQIFFRNKRIVLDFDYDAYWEDKRGTNMGHLTDFQLNRLNIINSEIKANSSIKDVGCGDGSALKFLNSKKSFSKMYGYDISEKALFLVRKSDIQPEFLDLDSKSNYFKKTDYTMALEVIEHVKDSEKLILSLLESTNDKLFISIPNSGFFSYRLRLLFGKFPIQWRLSPNEHLRFWTLSDIKWTLGQLNLLNNCDVITYEGIPVLNKMFPSLFAMGVILVIKK